MSTAAKQEKDRVARLWACRRGDLRHVRVGQRRQDGTQVDLLGMASDLHGPRGLCTCCPRGGANTRRTP